WWATRCTPNIVHRSAPAGMAASTAAAVRGGESLARLTAGSGAPADLPNAEWDALALTSPLIHFPTNTRIHLVGVHHTHSQTSMARVKTAIETLKPKVVCLETTAERLAKSAAGSATAGLGLMGTDLRDNDGGRPRVLRYIASSTGADFSSGSSAAASANRQAPAVAGQEIAEAVRAAQALTPPAHIKAVDVPLAAVLDDDNRDPRIARRLAASIPSADVAESVDRYRAQVRRVKELYRVHRPTASSKSISPFGVAMFRSLHAWMLGGARCLLSYWADALRRRVGGGDADAAAAEVRDQIWMGRLRDDKGTVDDHRRSLALWGIFYPHERYAVVDLRDAVMTDRIRDLLGLLAADRAARNASGRAPLGDPDVIVAVVGKSHVFGMAALWDRFVAKQAAPKVLEGARIEDFVDAGPTARNPSPTDPIRATSTALTSGDVTKIHSNNVEHDGGGRISPSSRFAEEATRECPHDQTKDVESRAASDKWARTKKYVYVDL
ncbi:hypothetical protein DFJ73DRAFT_825850, partial [Zopfochytrium polystomum]